MNRIDSRDRRGGPHTDESRGDQSSWRRRYILLLSAVTAMLSTVWAPPTDSHQARAAAPDYFEPPAVVDRDRSPMVRDQFAAEQETPRLGGGYPLPNLEKVDCRIESGRGAKLAQLPRFDTALGDSLAGMLSPEEVVFFTMDRGLQEYAERIVNAAHAPHVAVVAMEPSTGRILALAEKSTTLEHAALHAGFPAASVFKVITTAAALEEGAIDPETTVSFRGGTYTLERWNYMPDQRRDNRIMSVSEALGRSCNPVFGRIALQTLNGKMLSHYADQFGFNGALGFDAALQRSSAFVPDSDPYELSRTGAGFGDVTMSPVHAATMISGIANHGLMPRPTLVEKVVHLNGLVKYRAEPQVLRRMVSNDTSTRLLGMMESTTTIGTSRREFMVGTRPVFGNIRVAAKTGTLSGMNPKGLNNWFVAAAPIENPRIAIAVITVNAHSHSSKASALGRRVLQRYLLGDEVALAPTYVSTKKSTSYRSSSKYRSVSVKKTTTKSKIITVKKPVVSKKATTKKVYAKPVVTRKVIVKTSTKKAKK